MIEWTKDLDVEDSFINEQHKTLIGKLNEFLFALKKGKGKEEIFKTLKFLDNYAIFHFDAEENYMKKINYPDYSIHKEKHIYLKNELKNYNDRIKKESESLTFILNFASFFTDWLLNHIKKEDKKIGEFLKNKE